MSNITPFKANQIFASNTSNKGTYNPQSSGIPYQGDVVSNLINGELNKIENAIRFLQLTASQYDSTMDYVVNSVVKVLVAENGIIRERLYQCVQNVTGTAPISGSPSATNGVSVFTISSSTTENTTYWKRIIANTNLTATQSLSSSRMYLIQSNSVTQYPQGEMVLRVRKNDQTTSCVFRLQFFGMTNRFKITSCEYADFIKSYSGVTNWGILSFPGFALLQNNDGLYFACFSTGNANVLEIEYHDTNFKPPLTSASIVAPSSSNKPYAIRPNGGTQIDALGCEFNSMRNTGNATNGETYAFYQFINGFVPWSSAIQLNTYYFHQYANGGFGSLNIDVSDCVTRNVGANAGQSAGVIQQPQLPNTRGKLPAYSVWNQSYQYAHMIYPWACNWGNPSSSQIRNGIRDSGVFNMYITKNNDLTNGAIRFRGIAGDVQDLTAGAMNVEFNQNQYNPIYTDGGEVRMKTLVMRKMMRAF